MISFRFKHIALAVFYNMNKDYRVISLTPPEFLQNFVGIGSIEITFDTANRERK